MSVGIFLLSSWSQPPTPPIDIPFYDKWAHMILYGALSVMYLNTTTNGFTRLSYQRIFVAWMGCALFGLSDEWHQSFVPGRYSDVQDWLADVAGATLIIGIWFVRNRHNFSQTGLTNG
ncbi:MAG: VanZ family protein [SAR324 cluster bacterium]|nr:VanZ family protein [SAR324 cluster bacterium]